LEIVGLVLLTYRSHGTKLSEKDTIFLAEFANTTGDSGHGVEPVSGFGIAIGGRE